MSTCPICGHEFFEQKHPDKVYCSWLCWCESKWRVTKCNGCGTPFLNAKHPSKYCSAQCAFKNRDRRTRDETKTTTHTCPYCKKEFQNWTYRNSVYCSIKCARADKRKPESYVTLKCEECGQEYTVGKFFVEKRTSRYCSRDCLHAGMSKRKRGAGNVNYRGGTIKDRGRNWRRQKRLAMVRDGYKCQLCHRDIRKLKPGHYGVHHIIPYRKFNGDYETANQLTNLVTLCRSCHTKIEFGTQPCPKPLF